MAAPAAQDYVEILNLYSQYNLCSDAGDAEGYAACFAKKGVLELVTAGLTLAGHENFVEFKKKDKAGRPHIFRRHWNGSIHLDTQADGTVRGRCYLMAFNGKLKEIPAIADCGVYEDTLVKEDGAWKFLKRHLVMDATTFVAPMKSAGVA
jgi:hypothetical protein